MKIDQNLGFLGHNGQNLSKNGFLTQFFGLVIKVKIVQNLVFFTSKKSKFWSLKVKNVQNVGVLGHQSQKI